MNSEEYANLAEVEVRHWFYSGKREIVKRWIERMGPLNKQDRLLDIGAGTAKFVEEMENVCDAFALDDHEESLDIARSRLPPDRAIKGNSGNLPFSDNYFSAVTALDVLEHIEDDHKAVEEAARVLCAGGCMIVTVPALPGLWSEWDVTLQHHRRYTRKSLRSLLNHPSLTLVHCEYINVAALPAVWAIRKWRNKWNSRSQNRSEDNIPPEPINSLLRSVFVGLACQRMLSFPAGVGLLAVLKKNAK